MISAGVQGATRYLQRATSTRIHKGEPKGRHCDCGTCKGQGSGPGGLGVQITQLPQDQQWSCACVHTLRGWHLSAWHGTCDLPSAFPLPAPRLMMVGPLTAECTSELGVHRGRNQELRPLLETSGLGLCPRVGWTKPGFNPMDNGICTGHSCTNYKAGYPPYPVALGD